jgi:hypothetical protein
MKLHLVQIYLRRSHRHNKELDMIGTSRHDTEIDMIGTSRHETEIDELQCDMQRKELYL